MSISITKYWPQISILCMFPFYRTYTERFLKNPVKREKSRFTGPLTTMCLLFAWVHRPIPQVKLGLIREIKVSIESGEHVGPLWAYNLTQAHKLACMHTMCLLAQAHISAKLGQIREIKLSMESGEHAGPFWAQNSPWACKLACMHPMSLHAQARISAKLG